MKPAAYCFAIMLIAANSFCQRYSINRFQVGEKLDLIVQKAIQKFTNYYEAGLSVGIIKEGIFYTYHFGETVMGNNTTPNDETIYEIASLTKTFTGTLLAKAIVENKISLDDDIRKYMDGKFENLQFKKHPILIRHLVTHMSGLPRMLPDHPELFNNPNYDSLPFQLNRTQLKYSKAKFFEDLKKVRIAEEPGEKFQYSNTGIQLLGYILEKIFKSAYHDLLMKNIIAKTQMKKTFLLAPKNTTGFATGYNGNKIEMPFTPIQSGAADGLKSTLHDMMKYSVMHLNEDDPVIRKSHEVVWGDIEEFAMGINWQLNKTANDEKRIFQSGGSYGFTSLICLYPESEFAVVLLSNVSDKNSQNKLSDVERVIYDEIKFSMKTPIAKYNAN